MGVDGPKSAGVTCLGEMIAQTVVDVEVEVEAGGGDALELVGLEVLNFDVALEGAFAVDAAGFGAKSRVKDDGDALNAHDRLHHGLEGFVVGMNRSHKE